MRSSGAQCGLAPKRRLNNRRRPVEAFCASRFYLRDPTGRAGRHRPFLPNGTVLVRHGPARASGMKRNGNRAVAASSRRTGGP